MIVKHKEKLYVLLAGLLALVVTLPVLSYAQYQNSSIIGKSLFGPRINPAALSQTLGSDTNGGSSDTQAIRAFYEARGNAPYWLADRTRAQNVLALLEDSWTHGLNPATYGAPEIRKLLEQPKLGNAEAAELELLLSRAAVRYGHDLTGMHIDPAAIRQQAKFWRAPLDAATVLERVTTAPNPAKALEALAPQDKFYKTLREELVRLTTEQEKFADILPIEMPGILRPGQGHRAVPKIRARLEVEHRETDGAKTFYDDRLAAAVMKFQKQNGMKADGVIGSKTLSFMNRSNRDRMGQIVANLERLRWLEQEKPERYILVNLPSQMLWAIEKGKVVEEMKVVVGMAGRPTRDFTATVTGVRFNPTWTVPFGIKMADMVPKLREDPYALTDKGIEMFRGYARNAPTLDPGTVDWKNLTRQQAMNIRMVQTPGDHNALGRVRILMDNEFDIYLHDTNHPEFFAEDERTMSSGCIRLFEPRKVANFVLSHNENWSKARTEKLIEAGETVEISAAKPFPVFIVYQTIWQDKDGRLVYGHDIYGRDKKLLEALAAAGEYWLPEQKTVASMTKEQPATLASAH
jgi:murein L,D-transpeptidase YcbB/YkuD